MQLHKKLNITATGLSSTAILLGLLTLSGRLHKLVLTIYPDLHPLEADKKYWPLENVVLWLIPILFFVSLALSIGSVSLRRSRYGIFLIVVGSIFILLCVYCVWYAWELGQAFGNP